MIVSTMSSTEIFNLMDKDLDRIRAYVVHREKELTRELRKSRRDMVSQAYDYHTPNADYVLVLRCLKNGYVSRLRFAFIKETLEYVTIGTVGGCKGIVSYSVHLLRRFAERALHDTSLPMRKILLKFTQQDVSSCLYYDDDFFVTACEQGICLGKFDKKREVILNRTFVSIDMLKESQMKAWEKINRYISLALEVKHEYGLYSDRFQNLLREIPVEMSLSIDEARSIYASFYNHEQDDCSAIEG